MENKSHAFMAGLFTIGLIAAVVFTLFWFNRDTTARVPYDLISRTSINGLSPESAVRYRGLDVGKVESIKFDPSNPGQIIIRILVDSHTPMTRSTFANLGFQGVTGLAYVALDDTGRDKTALVTSPTHVARLYMRPSFIDELQRRGDYLLRQAQDLGTSLNALFSPANREQIIAMVASIRAAADGINGLSKQMAPAAAQLPQTLATLNRTLASTDRLTHQLADPHGPLQRDLDSIGRTADQATDSLRSLQTTVESMNGTLQQSTLPRVNRLSDEVSTAAQAVGSAADTVNRNPRALLFGTTPPTPGPGEAGFSWPAAAAPASR